MYVSYKEILTKAWQLTIKNKFLWIFGFFASFISLEAAYEIILSQLNQLKNLQNLQLTILNLYESQINFLGLHLYFINQLAEDNRAYLFFILFIAVLLLFAWLVFTSQIVVIKSCALLYQGKKIRLSEILTASMPQVWSIALINILAKIVLYTGFIGFSLPLLYALLTKRTEAIFSGNMLYFIGYTIFAVVISFLTAFASNFIILKNLHLLDAIKEGWRLFSRNISLSLKIAGILFILKLVSLIIILSLSAIFIIPALAVIILTLNQSITLVMVLSLTLIILAFTVCTVLINALFTVFYLNAWTITFIKLAQENVFFKILHFIKNFPHALKSQHPIDTAKINKNLVALAKKTQQQAQVVSQIVEDKYKILEPKMIKEGQIILQKLEASYEIIKPKLKKEGRVILKNLEEKYALLKPKVKKALKKEAKKLLQPAPVKKIKRRKTTAKQKSKSK